MTQRAPRFVLDPAELSTPPHLPPETARFVEYLKVQASIDGWFLLQAAGVWDCLLHHQSRQSVTGDLMEIGVYHGKSAALMALHTNPDEESCLLIDKFLREDEIRNSLRLIGRSGDKSIQLHRRDSRQMAHDPATAEHFGRYRWLHIDGEHSARAVMSDLALAHKLLQDRGIVSVDDFFSWWYPQITEAVFRYVRENPDHFQLFLIGYNKAYLAPPQFHHELLAYCAEHLVGDLEVRGIEAMVTKTTVPAELNCIGVGPRMDGLTRRGLDWDQKTLRY